MTDKELFWKKKRNFYHVRLNFYSVSSEFVMAETEVKWEDQQMINSFGKLNNEMHEIEDDLKKQEVN